MSTAVSRPTPAQAPRPEDGAAPQSSRVRQLGAAVLRALLVQTVASGVTQLGWRSQLSSLFIGIFILIAVGADLIRQRARRTA